MNKVNRAILLGCALGDGHVQVRTRQKGNCSYVSACLNVCHGDQQREYCEWKARKIGKALGGKQISVNRYRHGPERRYWCYRFTAGDQYFRQIKSWLYDGKTKTITRKMLNMLTPEAVAIWYMDDGHARRNVTKDGWIKSVATNIATMCSEREVEIIIDWFNEVFGIMFKKRCKRTSPTDRAFFIECNTEQSRHFIQMIEPHVPDCMRYKLSHVADMQTHERLAPVGQCSHCGAAFYARRYDGLCSRCYSRDYYRRVERHKKGRAHVGFYKGDEIVRPNAKSSVRTEA